MGVDIDQIPTLDYYLLVDMLQEHLNTLQTGKGKQGGNITSLEQLASTLRNSPKSS